VTAPTTGQAISLATNYRLGVIWSGTTWTPYVNNVAGTPTSITITSMGGAAGTLRIGGAVDDSVAPWDGLVSEVVITNTNLSVGDRLELDNYFKAKWGLS